MFSLSRALNRFSAEGVGQYRRFFAEVKRRIGGKVLRVTLLGGAGVLLQVAAIGLILRYTSLLVKGQPFTLGQWSVEPRTSLGFLAAATVSVMALLVLSALLRFWYQRFSVRLGSQIEGELLREITKRIEESPAVLIPTIANSSPQTALTRIALNDTRIYGRAVATLVQTLVPLGTLIIGLFALFRIHWKLTLLLGPIALLFAGLLVRLGKRGASVSREFERASIAGWRAMNGLLFHLKGHSLARDPAEVDGAWETNKDLRQYVRTYSDIAELPYRGGLLSDTALAFLLPIVLASLSAASIRRGHDWKLIPVYVVALRYVFTSLRSVSSLTTVINRFYPQLRRIHALLSESDLAASAPGESFAGPVALYRAEGISRYTLMDTLQRMSESGRFSPAEIFLFPKDPAFAARFLSLGSEGGEVSVARAIRDRIPWEKAKLLIVPMALEQVFDPPPPDKTLVLFSNSLADRCASARSVIVISGRGETWRGTPGEFEAELSRLEASFPMLLRPEGGAVPLDLAEEMDDSDAGDLA
jgi:ABC-type multidrug transport system fused ATPase/permease subunit